MSSAMDTQLFIEATPNNFFFARLQSSESRKYIKGRSQKPLKFVSLDHIRDYFEGQRFEKITLICEKGQHHKLHNWKREESYT